MSKSPIDQVTAYTNERKNRAIKLATELAKRKVEALRLYRPLPFQERFHACTAYEAILQKGNRAGGPMRLSEPVLTPTGWVRMGDLKVGDTVTGGDGKPCQVTHVFEQGVLPLFKLTFDDGATAVCSGDHHWRCKLKKTERFPSHPNYRDEKWGVYSVWDLIQFGGFEPQPRERAIVPLAICEYEPQDVPLDPYTLGVILGDGAISCDSVSFTTEDHEIADAVSESVGIGRVTGRAKKQDGDKASCYGIIAHHNCTTGKPSPVKQALVELGLMGCRGEAKFIPQEYIENSVEVRTQLLRGLMDTDGTADKKGNTYFYSNSPSLCKGMVDLVRSMGGKAHVSWKPTTIIDRTKARGAPAKDGGNQEHRKRCLNMGVVWIDMPHFEPFTLERKNVRWRAKQAKRRHFHGRYLHKIEPFGNEKCRCIRVDNDTHTYVTRDYIVTHNSLAGFVEVARAVTGQDPYGKYPKKDGTAICLGYGEKHIGRVIHRYLFESGAFDIVRDPDTDEWRVYMPWKDSALEHLKVPAPPLIPRRFIKRHTREDGSATRKSGIVWEKLGDRVFSQVRFTTGWTLYAANSAGDPSQYQGFNVNLYHIDEDLATGGWYEEAVGRTCAVGGLIRWTAMPHDETPDISRMIERAEEQEGQETPTTVAIRASQDDNPYLDQEGIKRAEAVWATMGDEAVRKRKHGDLVTTSRMMYPGFSEKIHDVMSSDMPCPVQKIMQDTNGTPPYEWCRVMWVDPGHTIGATLFIAIPPPQIGEQPVVFDELYIPRCTPTVWADQVKSKVGNLPYQYFGMDAHGGRITSLTDGVDPRTAYSRELRSRGILSVDTRSNFVDGCDNIEYREQKVRELLAIGPEGYPGFFVVAKNCPNFCREMRYFKKKRIKIANEWIVTEKGDRRANTHLVDCFEYFAAKGAFYEKPPSYRRNASYASKRLAERKTRQAARNARFSEVEKAMGGRQTVSFGPGG